MSDEIQELRRQLQQLLDRQAIHDVLLNIARGVDRYDTALLAACIHPEAVIDMGGERPLTGAEFAAGLKPPVEPRPGRMHVIGNVSIALEGERASSEAYVVSCMDVLQDGAPHTRLRAGRYLDRFARENGAWRLVSRIMIDEWGRIDPISQAAPRGRHRGGPAPTDLSYQDQSAA